MNKGILLFGLLLAATLAPTASAQGVPDGVLNCPAGGYTGNGVVVTYSNGSHTAACAGTASNHPDCPSNQRAVLVNDDRVACVQSTTPSNPCPTGTPVFGPGSGVGLRIGTFTVLSCTHVPYADINGVFGTPWCHSAATVQVDLFLTPERQNVLCF